MCVELIKKLQVLRVNEASMIKTFLFTVFWSIVFKKKINQEHWKKSVIIINTQSQRQNVSCILERMI